MADFSDIDLEGEEGPPIYEQLRPTNPKTSNPQNTYPQPPYSQPPNLQAAYPQAPYPTATHPYPTSPQGDIPLGFNPPWIQQGVNPHTNPPSDMSHQHGMNSPPPYPVNTSYNLMTTTPEGPVLLQANSPTVVVVAASTLVEEIPSIKRAYVISCLVFWFCNFIFGGMGFCAAGMASHALEANNIQLARSRRTISLILSFTGVSITMVTVCILVVIWLTVW